MPTLRPQSSSGTYGAEGQGKARRDSCQDVQTTPRALGAVGSHESLLRASSADRGTPNSRSAPGGGGQPAPSTPRGRSCWIQTGGLAQSCTSITETNDKARQSCASSIGLCSTASGATDLSMEASPQRQVTPREQDTKCVLGGNRKDVAASRSSTPRRISALPRTSRHSTPVVPRITQRYQQPQTQQQQLQQRRPAPMEHMEPDHNSEFGHERRPGAPFVWTDRRSFVKDVPTTPGPGDYRPAETMQIQNRSPSFGKRERWAPENRNASAISPSPAMFVPASASERLPQGGRFSSAPRWKKPEEAKGVTDKPGPGAYTPRYRSTSRFK